MNFAKTFLAALLALVVGFFVVSFFWVILLVALAGSSSESISIDENSILKIDLSEAITDAPSKSPFAGLDFMTLQSTEQIHLLKALSAIKAAAEDERIEGIYLNFTGSGGVVGTATMEELRAAIADFKLSGKFVVSYNEVYSQGGYYLASVADKIYLQPEGGMDFTGLSSGTMFFKGLFDKLDIKAEIFRPTSCKYKSAVEPYFLKKMSKENRAQMQQLINSMWSTISAEVAASRSISVEKLNLLADNLSVTLPEEALEYGFVDGLIYEDQMRDKFIELGVELGEDEEPEFVSLGDYASQLTPDVDKIGAEKVAVIYANGAIVSGYGSEDQVYGNALAEELAELREDDDIKAVVLRVNSPGGSALASDVIWREMELLKAEKPVVVSMGSYAASGGYYIAAPADVILADKMTLTGSIGVFGAMFDLSETMQDKLGITYDEVNSNENSGFSQFKSLTSVQRRAIMRGVDKVYDRFTSLVAEGRNLPIEKVLSVAEGRVWSGEEALKLGLVDGIGGIEMAIAMAAEKADLGDEYRVVEKIDTPEGLAAVLASLNVELKQRFELSELGGAVKEYNAVREVMEQSGIVMYSPYRVEFK